MDVVGQDPDRFVVGHIERPLQHNSIAQPDSDLGQRFGVDVDEHQPRAAPRRADSTATALPMPLAAPVRMHSRPLRSGIGALIAGRTGGDSSRSLQPIDRHTGFSHIS